MSLEHKEEPGINILREGCFEFMPCDDVYPQNGFIGMNGFPQIRIWGTIESGGVLIEFHLAAFPQLTEPIRPLHGRIKKYHA